MIIRYHGQHEVYLVDDGTMDTVISVDGEQHRFDGEYASQFRNKQTGAMTAKGLRALAMEVIDGMDDSPQSEAGDKTSPDMYSHMGGMCRGDDLGESPDY